MRGRRQRRGVVLAGVATGLALATAVTVTITHRTETTSAAPEPTAIADIPGPYAPPVPIGTPDPVVHFTGTQIVEHRVFPTKPPGPPRTPVPWSVTPDPRVPTPDPLRTPIPPAISPTPFPVFTPTPSR